MAFVRLDHVQLAMPPGGESQAISFYCDILGFAETPRPGELSASPGVWFRRGPIELHLAVEPGFRASKKAHPAIQVDDLDEMASICTSAGCPLSWDTRYPGRRRFFVEDPFGNRIEFLQPNPR